MTAVKTIARVLAVLALAASASPAGPLGNPSRSYAWPTPEFKWKAWNSGRPGAISNALSLSAGPAEGVEARPEPVAAPTRPSLAPPTASPTPSPAPVAAPAPPPSPAPALRLAPAPAPVPVRVDVPAAPPAAPVFRADARIEMGDGPFVQGDLLTGQPGAWYRSPVAQEAFGGTPDAQQRQAFSDLVLHRVDQAFNRSGLDPVLTTDSLTPADHVMSVVSGAYYGEPDSEIIGITDVGNNGFSLIDKMGGARTVDELANAVANNVAHELMHAFGVADHPDETGQHLDSGVASFDLLTSSDATFSQAAVRGMLAEDGTIRRQGLGAQVAEGGHPRFCACQKHVGARNLVAQIQAVPEPATMALWGVAGLGAMLVRRLRRRDAA